MSGKSDTTPKEGSKIREFQQPVTEGPNWWYEAIRSAPVLDEPRLGSSIIAELRPEMRVKVVGRSGDYFVVESVHGRLPGYVARSDVVPTQ